MYKGGGTVWDGFAYDPTLNLVYFGTANAAPYDLRQLGPGEADALFTATILASQSGYRPNGVVLSDDPR